MKLTAAALAAAIAAFAGPALAKPKPARVRAKPRVLLFDPADPKKRPTFETDPPAPEKVSSTPIMFTTVTAQKAADSDEPADVSVSEKNLMLDQGKTEKPKKSKKK